MRQREEIEQVDLKERNTFRGSWLHKGDGRSEGTGNLIVRDRCKEGEDLFRK